MAPDFHKIVAQEQLLRYKMAIILKTDEKTETLS
jgi:hypothetical protein